MVNYEQNCGGHMRKSTKKIQEIRDFLSHTDWVYKQARLFVLITTVKPGISDTFLTNR